MHHKSGSGGFDIIRRPERPSFVPSPSWPHTRQTEFELLSPENQDANVRRAKMVGAGSWMRPGTSYTKDSPERMKVQIADGRNDAQFSEWISGVEFN